MVPTFTSLCMPVLCTYSSASSTGYMMVAMTTSSKPCRTPHAKHYQCVFVGLHQSQHVRATRQTIEVQRPQKHGLQEGCSVAMQQLLLLWDVLVQAQRPWSGCKPLAQHCSLSPSTAPLSCIGAEPLTSGKCCFMMLLTEPRPCRKVTATQHPTVTTTPCDCLTAWRCNGIAREIPVSKCFHHTAM